MTLAGVGALTATCTTRSSSRLANRSEPAGPEQVRLNALSAAELSQGWRLAFDGTTLRGWRGLGLDTVPTAHWVVEQGTIKKIAASEVPRAADGQPLAGRDLITTETYRDFEFAWEWKISPGGNSGVKYNVSEALSLTLPPAHAAKGFEYQMLDDDRHADGRSATHRAGALYDLLPASGRKHLHPVGEWNASRIVLRGDHGEHWLNGERIVEYDLGTPAINLALAQSKFRSMAWFAQRRSGHIVLQDHGDAVWFRNLKVRELRSGSR
ncbi:MAG: hypothetical protein NVS4B3_03730 [Gemmatimonadaceae bacterium]